VIDRAALAESVAEIRKQKQKIVLTNGCFDIIHVGHIRYLAAAKSFGDVLIVGLNSDASVKRLKGARRPVVSQQDRAEVLLALKTVDYVTIFDEDTAEALVSIIRPDVYVKGGDYSLDNNPEARIVVGYGGSSHFIQLVPGRSTSSIIESLTGSAE
jgi:glycerol-3-phosphate cytidylyltransferase